MKISKKPFGTTSSGEEVDCFILENNQGNKAEILTYGGILKSFIIDGVNIVKNYNTLKEYEEGDAYLGALIGRVGNRIGNGEFTIDGENFSVPINNGPNCNHGGLVGFDSLIWDAEETPEGLKLSLTSPDGDQGFPGELDVTATYSLDDNNALKIEFEAETDKKTPVNLTAHPYFNLLGEGTIKDHTLYVFAEEMTESDENLLPTGKIVPVYETALDFTEGKPISEALSHKEEKAIKDAHGVDHNFIIKKVNDDVILPMAKLEAGNLILRVNSDQPGIQVYTGNYLPEPYSAVAIEPQNWPDSVNKKNFPNMILEPGEKYHKVHIYQVLKKDEES